MPMRQRVAGSIEELVEHIGSSSQIGKLRDAHTHTHIHTSYRYTYEYIFYTSFYFIFLVCRFRAG